MRQRVSVGFEELMNLYFNFNSDLQSKIFPSNKVVIIHVRTRPRTKYSRGGVTELHHRLASFFKKTRSVLGKVNEDEQK